MLTDLLDVFSSGPSIADNADSADSFYPMGNAMADTTNTTSSDIGTSVNNLLSDGINAFSNALPGIINSQLNNPATPAPTTAAPGSIQAYMPLILLGGAVLVLVLVLRKS